MIGIVTGNLQWRASRQQPYPNLPPSADVSREGHRLAVGRQRRKFFHTHKVGEPHQLYGRRIVGLRPQSSCQEGKPHRRECHRCNQSCYQPASTFSSSENHSCATSTFLTAEQFQIEGQVARRLKPFSRILFQTAMYDARQRRRKIVTGTGKLGGLLLEDCTHGVRSRLPLKSSLSGKHFVQDCAQTENIGAMVHSLSTHLLG